LGIGEHGVLLSSDCSGLVGTIPSGDAIEIPVQRANGNPIAPNLHFSIFILQYSVVSVQSSVVRPLATDH